MNQVVVLADAGPTVGVGHVMRCLTLGAALRDLGVTVELWSRELPDALRERAHAFGISTMPRRETLDDLALIDRLVDSEPGLVVLDSYSISNQFVQTLDRSGLPSLVIDDNRETPILAPLAVLNQNLHATSAMYADVDPSVARLVGPHWVLVRPEIVAFRNQLVQVEAERVMVALGGADAGGLTSPIVEGLERSGLNVSAARGLMGPTTESVNASDPQRFAAELATCSVAVIAAGTTMWEAACLGTPAVALIMADNQHALARASAEIGLADVLDARNGVDVATVVSRVEALMSDGDRRSAMSAIGKALVDGEGSTRTASWIADRLAANQSAG